ncbi:hypothetical protein [Nocardioides panaciterrulae]|uniref:Uncharacterized protein n=1 Tax=Nocardioides panaciterrulae TaxID=661492 RepID=A0A7Y9EA80_9ACTN|nr:hypothetical protein [Nocardioides panaciterrulae]NYD39932.1 hypothetical protein [Nocardioides panaciterrulae]NYD43964.1 hypothetical protein [Nocardioides panaciterrulae]
MSAPRKFEARYPGRCPACHEPIDVGDDPVMEDHRAVHFECAGDQPRPQLVPREICPRCFTEKSVSGACACDDA